MVEITLLKQDIQKLEKAKRDNKMSNFNNPNIRDGAGNNKIRRYAHQPIAIDHFDTHCQIQPNGKVKLTRPVKGSEEYDEIEVSASLILRLARLLKDTRSVEFVSVTEVKPEELAELKAQQE